MAEQPKEFKVKLGTRLSNAEAKALDPKDIGRLYAQPRKVEIEAEAVTAYRLCPYCGCVGTGAESQYAFHYFTCHCCGAIFRG